MLINMTKLARISSLNIQNFCKYCFLQNYVHKYLLTNYFNCTTSHLLFNIINYVFFSWGVAKYKRTKINNKASQS